MNRGYSLSKAKIWKESAYDGKLLNGIEFTYSSDSCGFDDIVHMYGSQVGNLYSTNITKKVIAISGLAWW